MSFRMVLSKESHGKLMRPGNEVPVLFSCNSGALHIDEMEGYSVYLPHLSFEDSESRVQVVIHCFITH